MKVIYKRAKTREELLQILELQHANFSSSISLEDKIEEGFVTVKHRLDLLKAMNDTCAHIIAIEGQKVVGYALCMVKEFRAEIDVLTPMFKEIDGSIINKSYIIMGQICIDKQFRRKGIFKGMYTFMREQLCNTYDLVITEVDSANKLSLNAHFNVGFRDLKTYSSNNQKWQLIYWEWS